MNDAPAIAGDLSSQALVDRAGKIADSLIALSPADEAEATLSSETVALLEGAGMFRVKLPAVLGGAEADPVTQVLVIEALS